MSVLQVKGRTTESYQEFEEASHSSNSLIFTNASPNKIENFSLELSVGEGWSNNYSPNDKNLWRIVECLKIKGHDSVVVEAGEEIRIPHNRYGVVLPTGSLFLSRGVLVASAKVEPAFHGKLKLRIYNTTNKHVNLKKGEKLGSIIFFPTESTHTHEPISRASEISTLPISKIAKLQKWFSLNTNLWIGWIISIIGSSLVSSVLVYFLYYKPMLDMQRKNSDQHAQSATLPKEIAKR